MQSPTPPLSLRWLPQDFRILFSNISIFTSRHSFPLSPFATTVPSSNNEIREGIFLKFYIWLTQLTLRCKHLIPNSAGYCQNLNFLKSAFLLGYLIFFHDIVSFRLHLHPRCHSRQVGKMVIEIPT